MTQESIVRTSSGRVLKPAEEHSHACSRKNVADWERLASLGGGAYLIVAGARRGGLIGMASFIGGVSLVYRGWTGYCSAYDFLGLSSREDYSPGLSAHQGIRIEESIIINKPAAELYDHWSRLEQLPQLMSHLESVTQEAGQRSHWIAKGPLGWNLEWDAETIQDRPNELIAWQSLPGSQVDTAGSVHFREVPNRGTELKISLRYDPPGGQWVASLAEFFQMGVDELVRSDLRRFKQWCETGEIATTEGQASGRNLPIEAGTDHSGTNEAGTESRLETSR